MPSIASTSKIIEKASLRRDANGFTTVRVDWGGEIATFDDPKKAIIFSDRINQSIEEIFNSLNV